jgi:hypothetical protein
VLALEGRYIGYFAVLFTVDADLHHSAGVTYGLCVDNDQVVMYVMTRRHLRKTRNIATNPNVSLVIHVSRWWLWFVPPGDDPNYTVELRFWTGRIPVGRRFSHY